MFSKFGLEFGLVIILIITIRSIYVKCDDDIGSKAIFTIYQKSTGVGSRWIEGTNLSSYGCDLKGNFSMVTHGWADFVPWLQEHLQKLLQNRGGCVIYLNYSDCVDDSSYLASLKQFYPLSAVITKRLNDMENEGVSPNNMHGYGFSMGARIMIDSSINFGPQKMKTLDVCEPANVGFDNSYNKDPKDAAQNVQCIFSSSYAGSVIRDQCHQNWLIGDCGKSLPGNQDASYMFCSLTNKCRKMPLGSHPMCNDIYNSAFDNDFYATNTQCPGVTDPSTFPADFKMGINEDRKYVRGVFASPTYKNYPHNSPQN